MRLTLTDSCSEINGSILDEEIRASCVMVKNKSRISGRNMARSTYL